MGFYIIHFELDDWMYAKIEDFEIPKTILKTVLAELGFYEIFINKQTQKERDFIRQYFTAFKEEQTVKVDLQAEGSTPFQGMVRIRKLIHTADNLVILLQIARVN